MGLFNLLRKDPKKEIMKLLDGYELPSFSTIVMQVLSVLRDPESTMGEVAELINRDPALIVSVFKRVNSASVGIARRVEDINQAITLLGRAKVESIVLSHAVRESLPKIDKSWFSMDSFWKSSSKRAAIASHLAKKIHPATMTQSFTGGMLQDMAIPVIAKVKGDLYKDIIVTDGIDSNISLLEKKRFSFDHQKVGALMAEEWKLPAYLTDIISGHHSDSVEPAIRLVSKVSMTFGDKELEALIDECHQTYNIDRGLLTNVIEQALLDAEDSL